MRRKTLGVARVVRQPVQVFYMQTAAPRTVDAPTLVFQIDPPACQRQVADPAHLLVIAPPAPLPTVRAHSCFFSPLELDDAGVSVLFITLNREDFSFVIHLDRQPRTSRRREAQTGSRARSGSRSERTLDAVEHSRTLMEWWPFLIFHRGGLRIKVINNNRSPNRPFNPAHHETWQRKQRADRLGIFHSVSLS